MLRFLVYELEIHSGNRKLEEELEGLCTFKKFEHPDLAIQEYREFFNIRKKQRLKGL